MGRWARSRSGVAALVAAFAFAVLTVEGQRDVLTLPIRFVLAVPVAAAGTWLLSRWWEGRNWPATPPFAQRAATAGGTRTLREDLNAEVFSDRGGFLFARRHFFTATGLPPVLLDDRLAAEVAAGAADEPVCLAATEARTWWAFGNSFYWENAGYDAGDVHALIARRERRHAQELRRAHTLLEVERGGGARREPIPADVRRAVFERDGGQCVACEATFDLQYDHVLPVAHGGASSVENLQLLCGACNREKSASI